MAELKAYRVEDIDSCEGYSTVVFAESRGKAKLLALSTDACEGADYIRIRATRIKDLDGEYRGRWEMDWYDEQDRRAMVSHGWYCLEPDRDDCAQCCCKDDCEDYQDYLEDEAHWLEDDVPVCTEASPASRGIYEKEA